MAFWYVGSLHPHAEARVGHAKRDVHPINQRPIPAAVCVSFFLEHRTLVLIQQGRQLRQIVRPVGTRIQFDQTQERVRVRTPIAELDRGIEIRLCRFRLCR